MTLHCPEIRNRLEQAMLWNDAARQSGIVQPWDKLVRSEKPLHRTCGHLQPKKTSKDQFPAVACFHFHPSLLEGTLAFKSLSDASLSTGELISWLSW